jgi:hypothetical protein
MKKIFLFLAGFVTVISLIACINAGNSKGNAAGDAKSAQIDSPEYFNLRPAL